MLPHPMTVAVCPENDLDWSFCGKQIGRTFCVYSTGASNVKMAMSLYNVRISNPRCRTTRFTLRSTCSTSFVTRILWSPNWTVNRATSHALKLKMKEEYYFPFARCRCEKFVLSNTMGSGQYVTVIDEWTAAKLSAIVEEYSNPWPCILWSRGAANNTLLIFIVSLVLRAAIFAKITLCRWWWTRCRRFGCDLWDRSWICYGWWPRICGRFRCGYRWFVYRLVTWPWSTLNGMRRCCVVRRMRGQWWWPLYGCCWTHGNIDSIGWFRCSVAAYAKRLVSISCEISARIVLSRCQCIECTQIGHVLHVRIATGERFTKSECGTRCHTRTTFSSRITPSCYRANSFLASGSHITFCTSFRNCRGEEKDREGNIVDSFPFKSLTEKEEKSLFRKWSYHTRSSLLVWFCSHLITHCRLFSLISIASQCTSDMNIEHVPVWRPTTLTRLESNAIYIFQCEPTLIAFIILHNRDVIATIQVAFIFRFSSSFSSSSRLCICRIANCNRPEKVCVCVPFTIRNASVDHSGSISIDLLQKWQRD